MGKPRLRRLSEREMKNLEEFALQRGLNLADIASNPMALQVPKARYIDVFHVLGDLMEVMENWKATTPKPLRNVPRLHRRE